MTSPFDSENRTGDIDNADNAPDRSYADTDRRNEDLHDSARDTSTEERGVQRDGSVDTHLRDERTLDDGRVVKSEPVDLGVKDVHADGQGCTCGNHGEGCTCGHHKTCDCPPGECHCHGHAGEQGAHRNEGGVPDHGDCECQQCQERRRDNNSETRDNGEEKDFTHPDTVNEDGTNPAVRTVDKAEGYNENASWNDGIEPAQRQEPRSYENEDESVN